MKNSTTSCCCSCSCAETMIVAVFHSWSADFFIPSCCLKRSKLSTLKHREVSYFGCWRCRERSFQRLCCHFRRSDYSRIVKMMCNLDENFRMIFRRFHTRQATRGVDMRQKTVSMRKSLLESWVDFYFNFQTLTWFGCKSSVIWSCGTCVFPWRCFFVL